MTTGWKQKPSDSFKKNYQSALDVSDWKYQKAGEKYKAGEAGLPEATKAQRVKKKRAKMAGAEDGAAVEVEDEDEVEDTAMINEGMDGYEHSAEESSGYKGALPKHMAQAKPPKLTKQQKQEKSAVTLRRPSQAIHVT